MSELAASRAPNVDAADEHETRDQILAAALRSVIRYGFARASMSDIAKEAGLSRGTVYRYFTDRNDLLDAMNDYIGRAFERELIDAVAAVPPGEERVRAVVDYMLAYGARPTTKRIQEHQPQFALGFLRAHFAEHLQTMTRAMGPPTAAAAVKLEQRGVTLGSFAELVLRTTTVNAFLERGNTNEVSAHLMALWRALST